MQVRYRYRIYPSPGQQQALARVFGCARVVYNDCLRVRDVAYANEEKINDTEIQRRVITLAKATPERAWLGEVTSVALVQACRDARRAYRNWFDSLQGTRKGPKVRHPKPRRKRGRQSIRLTRNGFRLHGERLSVPKVGDIKVEWSRELPSVPSSVTVIREPDGRYYASFVVERETVPLPSCDREVGIDLGLNALVVTSDGESIPNPRFLRKAQRRLKRAQRALSRKQKGSANRAEAKHRVAVLHRKVRDARLDHADAGWSQLMRCIQQKAIQFGRGFSKIGRFEPTSQVRNILAAGRADRLNACGTGVRPLTATVGAEAGTHRSAEWPAREESP